MKQEEIILGLQKENKELRELLEGFQQSAQLAVESWGDYSPKPQSRASAALGSFKLLLCQPTPERFHAFHQHADAKGSE